MGTVFYRVWCTLFYIENYVEIFPAHYAWKVTEKGFKIAFMMNKLAMIISFEIILEKQKLFFFAKNHLEIQVRILLDKIR